MLLVLLRLAFIPKCIAMIFLLRMQMLSLLLPSGEKGLNKEPPKLLFPEYLIVPDCPQRLELPVPSEFPMNLQHYHYQNLYNLCPSFMQLVV